MIFSIVQPTIRWFNSPLDLLTGRLFPSKYSIDPDYLEKIDGKVNYRIHGEDFNALIAFVVTEKTVDKDILEHYYRFVPDPLKRIENIQKYKILANVSQGKNQ